MTNFLNESKAEASLSKWVNSVAANYARELIEEFGQPDVITKSMVLWHDNRIHEFKRVYVKDEYIPHAKPRPHYDFVYSTMDFHVPENLMGAIAASSESIIIDQLKDEVTARCGDIFANAITLGFVQKVALGKIKPEDAPAEYEKHILEGILPSWFPDPRKQDNMNENIIKLSKNNIRSLIKSMINGL